MDQPLPQQTFSLYLPPELVSHIFSFCPPSSLASITRSSFTFLELASPFLYKSVRLEGREQLQRLFGGFEDVLEDLEGSVESENPAANSTSTHLDRITPYLSLSQIKHFTFLALSIDVQLTPLSRRRLPSSLPLLVLTTLTLSLPPVSNFKIIRTTQNTLLFLISPRTFNLLGRQPSERPSGQVSKPRFPYLDISELPWARLRTVLLLNSVIVDFRRFKSDIPEGFDITFNLADTWEPWRNEISQILLRMACGALVRARAGDVLLGKMLVVVDTEETKSWFKKMIPDLRVSGRGGEASPGRFEENVIVTVKEPGGERSEEWDVEDLTLTRM